ncbi:MAG: cyclopropane fatty acyl phospholipid synthase [Methylococcaceae bacterium]|nr:cyclopropane fatty acyl phospholipid synthase [Methylococcaceae bacterium]
MTAASTSISHNKNQKNDRSHRKIGNLLNIAGITIDGDKPWDIQVHNPEVFSRILAQGSVGLGESYMDGWWSCDEIDSFVQRLYEANLPACLTNWVDRAALLAAIMLNSQSGSRAFDVGRHHYDIGNDLYRAMLGERMIYSCGYWKCARTLDDAQEAKLDLVCRKLFLEPGMRVLDIGCGWGGAARFAAERYRVEVVGVTVSERQANIAREHCEGLPVTIDLKDYKGIEGRFDRIFSLGMFEHVGFKNYSTYMQFVADRLEPDGLFLLHTVGANYSDRIGNAWVEKYIFPNSMLPSIAQIGKATENLLVMEDWQNFGSDYAKTLLAWFRNFDASWPRLKDHYDQRFYRMWKYYLLSFAGAFRARENQLWQIVFSRKGRRLRYDAPR